jgi:hypothetical protein
MRVGHRRKSTNDREGSQCRNYDPAYGAFCRISVYKEASRKYFSLKQGRLKI